MTIQNKGAHNPLYRRHRRTYKAWLAMHSRVRMADAGTCEKFRKTYAGLTICRRWGVFANFLRDMGDCPPTLTLDRIDNRGDYYPTNCRWATCQQQLRNREPWGRTGVKGVYLIKGRFRVAIQVDGHLKHIGLFDTVEEAAAVRKAAEEKYWGADK